MPNFGCLPSFLLCLCSDYPGGLFHASLSCNLPRQKSAVQTAANIRNRWMLFYIIVMSRIMQHIIFTTKLAFKNRLRKQQTAKKNKYKSWI